MPHRNCTNFQTELLKLSKMHSTLNMMSYWGRLKELPQEQCWLAQLDFQHVVFRASVAYKLSCCSAKMHISNMCFLKGKMFFHFYT